MKKLIIGITGSFGTGKTTAAEMFKKLGAYVIDADKLAGEFTLPDGGAYKKVLSIFGAGILKKNKTIDKDKLAEIVFKDKKKLAILNSIVHPLVIKEIKNLSKKTAKEIVIIDAPLLLEAGLGGFVDKLVVVKAGRDAQIERGLKKGFSREDIEGRIRNQLALDEKLEAADFIIDNSGTRSSANVQVKKIWEEMRNGRN